jgi:hypothetical protein
MGLNRAGGGICITFSRHSPVWLAFHFATHKMDRDAPRLGFFLFFYLTVCAKTTWKLHDNTTSLSTCLWQHAFSRFSEIFPWYSLLYAPDVSSPECGHKHFYALIRFPKARDCNLKVTISSRSVIRGFLRWDRETFRKVIEGYIRYSKFI